MFFQILPNTSCYSLTCQLAVLLLLLVVPLPLPPADCCAPALWLCACNHSPFRSLFFSSTTTSSSIISSYYYVIFKKSLSSFVVYSCYLLLLLTFNVATACLPPRSTMAAAIKNKYKNTGGSTTRHFCAATVESKL